MKTFQEFITESTNISFHERLNNENPGTVRLIHAMALGHPITKAYDIAETEGEIKPPQKPVQHAYRKITDTASAFHYPDGDKTLDLKSVRRLIHGPLQVPQREHGSYDYGYETKIKKAGGIDKIMKQRKAGAGDAQIFRGQERRSVKRLRSYIESKYKDHPDYAARNKPKQEMASQPMIDDIMARKAQGHSHRQIAKDLNVTPGRIAGLIHRNKK
jgi:hypothetical protein